MTVPSDDRINTYLGANTTADFDFDWLIYAKSNVVVQATEDATGTISTLTLTTDYTIPDADVGDPDGGTITLVDADQAWTDLSGHLKTGYTLTLLRVLPLTQPLNMSANTATPPSSIEVALDKLTMIVQQQQDGMDAAITLPSTEDPSDFTMTLPPAAVRAGTAFVWDADGNPSTATLTTVGASPAASFVTISAEGSLTNERRLAGTANEITVTDNGAGNTVALSAPGITALKLPSYVTLGTTATLANERVLTGTANQITVTDNGAGGTVVLSLATPAAVVSKLFNARLTLATGVAVTTTDQTAKTTVYLTPYQGNTVALYDGAAWVAFGLTEISIAVPASTATIYDVFVYSNSGTPTLEATAWTNDTTRATALILQDGVYVKTGATTRRYCGSFRTTGSSGQTEDSIAKRYVWNYYNRVPRLMSVIDGTNSWTYTTATFRQANAAAANQLDFIIGVNEVIVEALVRGMRDNSGGLATAAVGVGVDSTSVNSATLKTYTLAAVIGCEVSEYAGYPGVGRHYLAWLEYSTASGTTTWYGDNNTVTLLQSGITGKYMG